MSRSLKTIGPIELQAVLISEAQDAPIIWNTGDIDLLKQSIDHAVKLHEGQCRGPRANISRPAYVEHPLRNTIRLIRWGCVDGDVLITSVLHDTLEDCAERIIGKKMKDKEQAFLLASEVMKQEYGDSVNKMLVGVTNPILPRSASHADKVQSYVDHMCDSCVDAQIRAVKTTDLYDNPGSLHHSITESFAPRARRMHTKYSVALPVVKEQYMKAQDSVPGLPSHMMVEKIENIEHNLSLADKMITAYGV